MSMKLYRNTRWVLFSFTLKNNLKQAVAIGIISSITIVSTAVGFADAYPTEAARALVAETFRSNTGLIAVIGKPDALQTIGGFTMWRSLGALTIIVSIWAIFLSSRLFRGDEEQGRFELVLTGKSTLANATIQLFASILVMLIPTFLLIYLSTSIVNFINDYGWSQASIILLASSVVLTALLFVSIGALCAQVAATRSATLRIAAAVFGVSFMLRALGDISNDKSWLTVLSPLGWLERMYPLGTSNSLWLIPIIITITATLIIAVAIAGRRDYGESLIPDNNIAKPKYKLLRSGSGLLTRLHKGNALLWGLGLLAVNFMFGTFLGTVTQVLSESGGIQNTLNKVTGGQNTDTTELFIGTIFMQMVLLMMIMVTSQVNAFRDDEARGYMDNLLVRQSSRIGLSSVKAMLITGSVLLAAAATATGMYLGAKSQDVYIDGWVVTAAGINLLAVPLLFLGIGLFVFGFLPRFTSVVLYSLIGWAFIVEIVGSVINVNHWILDTSILHHIALAPAVDVRWDTFWVYLVLALAAATAGIWRFTKRDIEPL
jgi:ABC-2 type transport system permease protein